MQKVEKGEISASVVIGVEKKEEEAAHDAGAIGSLAEESGQKIEMFLDISLFKITTVIKGDNVGNSSSENVGDVNTQVLEIAVPYDTANENLTVYRSHNGVVAALNKLHAKPTGSVSDGNFYVGNGYIYIYASGFSTYAIGETDSRAEGPEAPSGFTPEAPTTQGGSDGKIGGVRPDMEYSTDNGNNWTPVTTDPITGLHPGKVLIRKKGTTTVKPGKIAEVTLPDNTDIPAKNPAPNAPTGLEGIKPTTNGGTNGKITGVDSTMEYSTDGGVTWNPVLGTEITGLSVCEVWIRVKETASTQAGKVLIVTVPKYREPVTSPKTGESAPVSLYMSMMLFFVLACAILLFVGKRRKMR